MDSDLIAVLRLYPSVARPSSPPEPLGNAGGLSGARLWRYRSGLGPLVARAWPHDGPTREALEEIHGWLAEAAPVGFVPVPVAGLDGRTLQSSGGRFWEVTPWMPGSADPDRPPLPAKVCSGFSALAAVHQRLAHHRTPGPSPGLLSRAREVGWLLGGGFAEVERAIARQPADPLTVLAARWVDTARRAAPRVHDDLARAAGVQVNRQPCLRDVRPDHILFSGDKVTGLVDFGAMGIDTVATDLSRLASEWIGSAPALRSAGFAAYVAVRPVAPSEAALIEVFERSAALLGAGHWVRWHFLEGRVFADPSAVARGLEKGIERLKTLEIG
jgi:homoserine kinase type II